MDESLFFTEEHDLLRQTVREFAQRELVPHTDEWEEEGYVPGWVFSRMGELGLLGLHFPEEYGGGGGDYFTNIVLMEELALAGCDGVGACVGVQVGMATPPVLAFGSEEQKQRYLVPAIKGERIACLGITEPNAGSDVASISTFAEKVTGGWKVNGSKIFITNGYRADFMILLARTEKTKGYKGMSLFLVDRDTPGYIVSRKLDKVGLRRSDTGELFFQDMFLPDEALLGEEGRGFYNIMWELQGERLIVAATCVASARRGLKMAIDYARERVQFGRAIIENQAIAHRIADLAARIEAVQSLIYTTAWQVDRGGYPVKEVSMAKLLAAQLAFDVADEAMQFMGGYGYMMEYEIQRLWRDIRILRIAGGTDEIQREIIVNVLDTEA